MTRAWALSDDLSRAVTVGALVLAAVSIVLLALETSRAERQRWLVLSSGVVGVLLVLGAVLRPVRVDVRGTELGPLLVVLVDGSRRLLLPQGEATRRAAALGASEQLRSHFSTARLVVLELVDGVARPLAEPPEVPRAVESDLSSALTRVASTAGGRPEAVVVVSDGRLTRPSESADDGALERGAGGAGLPIHTVRVTEASPPDASIRRVRTASAAVAHQPLALTVEIGCSGGLGCGRIPVVVRELRHGSAPALLASGVADVQSDLATVELGITLERAGDRILEIAIDSPPGDAVPENDRRLLPFRVTRERLRLLHVAGRPTYDVRALRTWLKSDESVDLIAFFILRSNTDDPNTDDESELALIPFPVDELFTEHLPSFDAVVLQDIDANEYKLARHLPALASYVETGGGLIMVGGPSAFAGGGYAGSALGRVLPVELSETDRPFDTLELVPRVTEVGRAAPVLRGVRDVFADELPVFVGSSTLGRSRAGSLVLWEHPHRRAGELPMPVLALGEAGDGRSIALGLDATYRLAWSELGAAAGGRAYGALWDGLLGWLMRDPRYEAARVELTAPCVAGLATELSVTRLPGTPGVVQVEIERLGEVDPKPIVTREQQSSATVVSVDLGPLEEGGYAARVRIGSTPPTRLDFACERGGEAWSDSRPDPARLERISRVTGGRSVTAAEIRRLPLPTATLVATERQVTAVLPPWLWALGGSIAIGAHWYARRRAGLG